MPVIFTLCLYVYAHTGSQNELLLIHFGRKGFLFKWTNVWSVMFFILFCSCSHSAKLHHETIISLHSLYPLCDVYLLFISFAVKCASSALSLPLLFSPSLPVIWMGISRQTCFSELKCWDHLYLLPHEMHRENNLCRTTMGRAVNIFSLVGENRLSDWIIDAAGLGYRKPRQIRLPKKTWWTVTLVENL